MLNLNFNTIYSKLSEQPRGYNQPYVSASFFLYGAGGPGALALPGDNTNFRGGGGGGAGMIVSGTINITPDSEYTFTIPNSSSATDTKGGDSTFNGFDNDTIFPISAFAGGGFRPQREDFRGGSGNIGVYNHPNFTASYSAFASGSGNSAPAPSGTTQSAGYGAGAGSGQNGGSSFVSSSIGPNALTQKSGTGGNGVTSSITLYGWEGILPFENSNTAVTNLTIGAAGGGGGDVFQKTVTGAQPSQPGFAGVPNGGVPGNIAPGITNKAKGPGAGGGGNTIPGITAITGSNNSGVGGTGAFIIIYPGIPKLQFSGSVETVYDAVNNATAHMVIHHTATNGTGSFFRSSGGPFDNNPNP